MDYSDLVNQYETYLAQTQWSEEELAGLLAKIGSHTPLDELDGMFAPLKLFRMIDVLKANGDIYEKMKCVLVRVG